MSKFLSLIAMWILLSTICFAGEKEEIAITQAFPQILGFDSSEGVIEGKKHLAAIISEADESSPSIALVVFELDQASDYKLRSRSEWMPHHERWHSLSVIIKNNSVYFSLRTSGGCCSDSFHQYQFKPQGGVFTLVGTESSETGTESKKDNNGIAIDGKFISYRYGTSINYLTGVVSHWRIQAPSSSSHPFKDDFHTIKVGKKRIEKRFNLAPLKKTLLDDFSVWADSDDQVKHLSGYFDENFEFHE